MNKIDGQSEGLQSHGSQMGLCTRISEDRHDRKGPPIHTQGHDTDVVLGLLPIGKHERSSHNHTHAQ